MAIDDKIDEATGRAKKAGGDLTGDQQLHAEGEKQETKGKVKGKIDEVADKLRDKVDGDK